MVSLDPPRLRIAELEIGDDPAAWRAAGLSVDDRGIAQVSTVRLRFVGNGGQRGIRRWSIAGIASATLDGLAGELDSGDARASHVDHANTTVLLDHIVIATPDVQRTVDAFRAIGIEPRRERVGGSGTAPVRQVFVRAGEVIIEIVGPPSADERAERRSGPARFWGLAFSAADLDACASALGEALGPIRDAVQPGRRIATLHHEQLDISVPVAWMSA